MAIQVTPLIAVAIAISIAFFSTLSLAKPPPDSKHYKITMMSRLTYQMSLLCETHSDDESNYFDFIALDPNQPRKKTFTPTSNSFAIKCMYRYEGNYADGITLFDSRWPNKEECLAGGGGCKFLFDDGRMFNYTAKGGKKLVGDLPVRECRWFLLYSFGCREKRHDGRLAGRIISRWDYWTHV